MSERTQLVYHYIDGYPQGSQVYLYGSPKRTLCPPYGTSTHLMCIQFLLSFLGHETVFWMSVSARKEYKMTISRFNLDQFET